jgi:hypothetical protein
VLAFIEPVLGVKSSIFMKTSLKTLVFIPNLAQRHLYQLVLEGIRFGGSFSEKNIVTGKDLKLRLKDSYLTYPSNEIYDII